MNYNKPKEIVLITGVSGMISKSVAMLLKLNNFEVRFLSRTKKASNQFVWDFSKNYIEPNALTNVQHIIHLAGANISDKRWTKKRKKVILDSRIQSTKLLFEEVQKHQISLKTFISASAVGYYGTTTKDVIFTEESPCGNDFLAQVCILWEKESDLFSTYKNTRVVKLRFGVVLDSNGGALAKMIKPITMGIGAVLGNGKQYIPWIHIEDLCQLLLYSLNNSNMIGSYNAVAPQHITNKQLTNLLAYKLHKRIWLPKAPSFILKLLFGEMSSIILKGNRVSCEKLLSSKFTFKYPKIDEALDNLL
ncbi:MAG: TIGR01777 family oxidoreductase [Flavobacteriaceae bacterium]|nr:TIGR01777 family oxidoreductase [Flavobacteriaceae bacterium]